MADCTSAADDFEARWPKEGDRLFVESDWAYDAHLVGDPEERFYRLTMGYKRAGDLLVDQATADVVDRRNVVYAALFCYRQFIELSLKYLVAKFSQGKVYEPKNTHDLNLLWERVKAIIDERGGGSGLGLDAVEKLVAEMDQADRKADGFRFPVGTDGNPFGFGDRGIDLGNLRAVMQGLENFFDCTSEAFENEEALALEAGEQWWRSER